MDIKCRFSHFGFYIKYKNQFIRKKKIQIVGLDNWVVSKKHSEAITQI